MLAIRLPAEIENRLTTLAQETGRTKTFYVREAILNYLEDLEDYYAAEKRYRDLQAGKSRRVSLEEMEKELELDA
ncbi:MAG: TraY domain-containing protein [Neisseriaceae bacterium]|nr:TraY domain-containing protein [Neisseriaceae bacterium]MBR5674948.1 TraY domain-containing protein [Neisseriaceae bacterium]